MYFKISSLVLKVPFALYKGVSRLIIMISFQRHNLTEKKEKFPHFKLLLTFFFPTLSSTPIQNRVAQLLINQQLTRHTQVSFNRWGGVQWEEEKGLWVGSLKLQFTLKTAEGSKHYELLLKQNTAVQAGNRTHFGESVSSAGTEKESCLVQIDMHLLDSPSRLMRPRSPLPPQSSVPNHQHSPLLHRQLCLPALQSSVSLVQVQRDESLFIYYPTTVISHS